MAKQMIRPSQFILSHHDPAPDPFIPALRAGVVPAMDWNERLILSRGGGPHPTIGFCRLSGTNKTLTLPQPPGVG